MDNPNNVRVYQYTAGIPFDECFWIREGVVKDHIANILNYLDAKVANADDYGTQDEYYSLLSVRMWIADYAQENGISR